MANANLEIELNVRGLEILDAFLEKHRDKIQLVGSFELKPGDCLVFETEHVLSTVVFENILENLKKYLPDIKVVILEQGIKLACLIKQGVIQTAKKQIVISKLRAGKGIK